MDLQSQIVSKIRRLRHEKGYSQPQMAEMLNMEKSVYARLETGKTYSWAKYLEELLEVFEIAPDIFFEDIGTDVVINNNNCP
jgi:transcriptional regulator with XRE-family HTH domain